MKALARHIISRARPALNSAALSALNDFGNPFLGLAAQAKISQRFAPFHQRTGIPDERSSDLKRRGRLRKLRRALTVRMCISQSVAATKRFA